MSVYCYIMIGLMYLKELMLIKPINHVGVSFVLLLHLYYYYFLKLNFRFQLKVCNDCNNLMQKAMIFIDLSIVSINGNDYRINSSFLLQVRIKPCV